VLAEEKLSGQIRHLLRTIDALGIDQAAIGTDLPAGVARTELPGFSRHPAIAASLVDRGLTREETEKVCSGNWLRVLRSVRS
jgi:membrane dipeptidase